ncbi:MAG: HlyD family efflux transporter periplasmic adaptor subunit [Pseudomonadota bacterium]
MKLPSLFRQQAVDFQRQRLLGDVIVINEPSLVFLTAIITTIVAGGLTMLSLGEYARKERVSGYLVLESGLVKVYAPDTGKISRLHVEDGDHVTKGDVLASLSTERFLRSGKGLEVVLLSELDHQKRNYEANIVAERRRAQLERSRTRERIAAINARLKALRERLKLQVLRSEIARDALENYEKLVAQDLGQRAEHVRRRQQHLLGEQNRIELQETIGQQIDQLSDARFTLNDIAIRSKKEVGRLKNALIELAQRRAEIENRKDYVIRAATTGRVTALRVTERQTISSDTLLMAIVPHDDELEAELLLPARAIGLVRRGQKARLYYSAFPQQRFGAFNANITTISKTILTAKELPAPVEIKEPVYIARAELERQAIDVRGQKIELQSGLLLDADIILERRTLLQWLLDPLRGAVQGKP